jgi:hypothetical protein
LHRTAHVTLPPTDAAIVAPGRGDDFAMRAGDGEHREDAGHARPETYGDQVRAGVARSVRGMGRAPGGPRILYHPRMSDAVVGAILGGLAVVVGGLLATVTSVVVEVLRARREWRLDKEKRAGDRRIERARLQRENLLGLQVAARELLEIEIQPQGPPSQVTMHPAWYRVRLFASRVDDDQARAIADALLDLVRRYGEGRDIEAGRRLEDRLMALIDHTGTLIRATF